MEKGSTQIRAASSLSQCVCLPLIQDEPEGSMQACLMDWMRPPRCHDCMDQADTAAGCPPAEPVRQEEEEEGAALHLFITYSALYIHFLKLVTYIKIFLT